MQVKGYLVTDFNKFEEQEGESIWYLMFFNKTLIAAVTKLKMNGVSLYPALRANPVDILINSIYF
jgi:hypothetical protein